MDKENKFIFGYAAVKQKNKWYLWSATQIREGFVTIHDLSGFMRSHERVINENVVFFPNKNSESFDRETFDECCEWVNKQNRGYFK